MKRALLVGSSFSAAPIFFALKQRGLRVTVCGNQPTDPCHQYSDDSLHFDYSQRDELLRVAQSGRFDYLVPTCNDYSYLSCAWVAQQLGSPGFDRQEVASILHEKHEFRRITEQHAIPAPRSRRVHAGVAADVESLRFPVLVKPTDSFSGRGVTKVTRGAELPDAVEAALRASRSRGALIEEFVEGSLHSHSAFLCGGAVWHDVFVDEFCTVHPYQVNCSNHPSRLGEPMRRAVRESINRLAGILGLTDGLLHTQFIVDGDSHWIIECMRRCPGDLYGRLVELSTGIPYVDLFVRPFVREPFPERLRLPEVRCFGRHTISRNAPQVCHSFSHSIPSDDVRVVPLKTSAERLGPAPFDKLAILFAGFDDATTMHRITPRFADLVSIETFG